MRTLEARGFQYSYDMLGESTTTMVNAERYYRDYENAVHAIGKASAGRSVYGGPGISIKLSALHPRYAWTQAERMMAELLPRVKALAVLAKSGKKVVLLEALDRVLARVAGEPFLSGRASRTRRRRPPRRGG